MQTNGCAALKVDLPYVQAVKSRGKPYYYFRRQGQPSIKLPGAPGSPEFTEAYERLRLSNKPREYSAKSLWALIAKFRKTTLYTGLAPKTRKDYGRYLDFMAEEYGDLSVQGITRPFIVGLREEFEGKPRSANYLLAVVRRILDYARDLGWIAYNPASRPKMLKTGPGRRAWKDEEIIKFLKGNPELEMAVALPLYTGQRGQDCVKMTWADYDGSGIAVVQLKTGAKVWIPAHRELRAIFDRTKRRADTILVGGKRGKPITRDYLTHLIADGVVEAGLAGITLHGLRKSAAKRLAEAGCSDAEIMSITGHKTANEARRYRQEADQKKLAIAAMKKVEKNAKRLTSVKPAVKQESDDS